MENTFVHDAANWSNPEDDFSPMFLDQNIRQFWTPEEIAISNDKLSWSALTLEEKDVYKKALAGLTLLDTVQGDTGMPEIALRVSGHQRKAVLNFMAMMENGIHARSYSSIFTTLITTEEIKELFNWVTNDKHLQFKAHTIYSVYKNIKSGNELDLYKGMVASVLLESYLFYSGFFYPLYLAGQGKMTASGEIIDLIIRDESIHGVYVGLLAREIYEKQTTEIKKELEKFTLDLTLKLYENEIEYTSNLYDQIGLTHEVKKFVRYNANKALQNLGFEIHFEPEEVNAVVMNGINTNSKDHDFFSKKGNSYQLAVVVPIKDEDFIFSV